MRRPTKFVGLHSHDGFSTYDGLSLPQEHIDFVIENGMDGWCLTNHGNCNSFAHAYLHVEKLRKAGKEFKFVCGVEAYLHPDLKEWRREYEQRKQEAKEAKEAKKKGENGHTEAIDTTNALTIENENETKTGKKYDPLRRRHHLVVLPKTSEGLQRIFHLVSRSYLEGFYSFPRIDYAMLHEAAKGDNILVSTACIGGIMANEVFGPCRDVPWDELDHGLLDDPGRKKLVMKGLRDVHVKLAKAVGPKNVYLELQFNRLSQQRLLNRALIEYATENGFTEQLIVTCDSHYARPEHWKEREVYKKLGWLKYEEMDPTKIPQSRESLKCELYPKNAEQLWDAYLEQKDETCAFYDDDVVCDAIERTYHIMHEVIGDVQPDREMKLPDFVIPEGKTAFKALVGAAFEGLVSRGHGEDEKYIERLQHELRIIKECKFAKYFLSKKAIMDVAREHMLIGPGRGSGAGSLVNYCLYITDVDPIRWNLLFERFLNKHRAEAPDIDSDLAERDKLIDLLKEKFGADNVIPISNYNTFQLKTLVKDIAKFYGIPFDEVNAATKNVEKDVKKAVLKQGMDKNLFVLYYDDAMEHSPSFRKFIEKYPHIAEPIKVLFKQNRALGRHAGGVIVCNNIAERMPLITSKGEAQTPWVEGVNFKHLEEFGWIKFDLLGLDTLRIIGRTIELILQRHHGVKNPTFAQVKQWYEENLHPDVVDFDDQKVYENVYHAGKWGGIFQCTNPWAQRLFKNAQPRALVDIATLTSIYRPGPLAAHVDKLYVQHSTGEPYDWGHPLINDTLAPTKGLIIFQEQVMLLAHEVAGFPLDECDKVRKAIMKRSISGGEAAKKKATELRTAFVDGAVSKGVPDEIANDLYDKILFFAGYGFNKAHAISYAMDSYFCAWLMTYYEPEWLCAYLESMSNNPDKRAKAFGEVKALGYSIVPIDVNAATKGWTILDGKRFMPSFLSCTGVGITAIDEIVASRPFESIEEMLWNPDGTWKPSKFNKKALEALIEVCAFDSMDLIGEDKVFSSYAHMHEVLIGHNDEIKKSLKRDPHMGMKEFYRLARELRDEVEPWSRVEQAQLSINRFGSLDVTMLIDPSILQKFDEHGVANIDDYTGEDVYWFCTKKVTPRNSKNGKKYLLIEAQGPSGKTHKIYAWGWDGQRKVEQYSICFGELKQTDFGFGTGLWKLKEVR